jgi:hypothetical protein
MLLLNPSFVSPTDFSRFLTLQSTSISLLIASALLTSTFSSAKTQILHDPNNSPYVTAVSTSHGFQGLTWGATCTAYLAAVLLFAEFSMERFTSYGERTIRHWKPRGTSWLAKRSPQLRRQQRERVRRRIDDEGRGW